MRGGKPWRCPRTRASIPHRQTRLTHLSPGMLQRPLTFLPPLLPQSIRFLLGHQNQCKYIYKIMSGCYFRFFTGVPVQFKSQPLNTVSRLDEQLLPALPQPSHCCSPAKQSPSSASQVNGTLSCLRLHSPPLSLRHSSLPLSLLDNPLVFLTTTYTLVAPRSFLNAP